MEGCIDKTVFLSVHQSKVSICVSYCQVQTERITKPVQLATKSEVASTIPGRVSTRYSPPGDACGMYTCN